MFGFARKKEIGQRGEPLPESNEGPPDTHRPRGLCPRCGKQSSFDILGSLPVTFDGTIIQERGGRDIELWSDQVSVLRCQGCGQGVVVVEEKWVGDLPSSKQRTGGFVSYRGIHWWPLPQAQVSADIPADIAEAYKEAVTCLSANAPRAAAAMARRSLEGITEDQGETTGTLANRLQALASKHILQPTLADWAKEVRLIGNAGAHFDLGRPVSIEDARALIDFIRELMRYLYEYPAELARRRGP